MATLVAKSPCIFSRGTSIIKLGKLAKEILPSPLAFLKAHILWLIPPLICSTKLTLLPHISIYKFTLYFLD